MKPLSLTPRLMRIIIFSVVAALHLVLILVLRFSIQVEQQEEPADAQVMKLVDVREYVPPPPPPPRELPPETVEVSDQPVASENIIEVEEEVVEVEDAREAQVEQQPDYLPQHQISEIPIIPTDLILSRIEYPPIALRQGIEGVVFVELFIDRSGNIRNIVILRDPGSGFAEAAIAAMEGITVQPAKANGEAVAVRFRYPIRFALN